MTTLDQILKERYGGFDSINRIDIIEAVGYWLGQHRHPMQPYPCDDETDLNEQEWHMREASRQTQIDELLNELGFSKVDVIPYPGPRTNSSKGMQSQENP